MLSSTAVTLPATKPRAQEVGRWLSLAYLEAFLWRLSMPWNNRGEKRGLPVTWLYSVLFQTFETNVKNILGIFACNMANIKSMLGHYCPECRCQARFVNTFLGSWHWIVVNLQLETCISVNQHPPKPSWNIGNTKLANQSLYQSIGWLSVKQINPQFMTFEEGIWSHKTTGSGGFPNQVETNLEIAPDVQWCGEHIFTNSPPNPQIHHFYGWGWNHPQSWNPRNPTGWCPFFCYVNVGL
jgi:hypothetical protein